MESQELELEKRRESPRLDIESDNMKTCRTMNHEQTIETTTDEAITEGWKTEIPGARSQP